jgi:hypothetical protein
VQVSECTLPCGPCWQAVFHWRVVNTDISPREGAMRLVVDRQSWRIREAIVCTGETYSGVVFGKKYTATYVERAHPYSADHFSMPKS